jgi:hypothetical protein
MHRRTFPYVYVAIIAVAISIVIAWQRSGQSESPPAPQVIAQPGISWNRLNSTEGIVASAAKVPGGWFVCLGNAVNNENPVINVGGAFFYPDPLHQWDGTSLSR